MDSLAMTWLNNDCWKSLLDNPADSLQIGACRIHHGYSWRTGFGSNLEEVQEVTFTSTSNEDLFRVNTKPGHYDACGQQAVVLFYKKAVGAPHEGVNRGQSLCFPIAVIGLNRHIEIDLEYLFWNGRFRRISDERKTLLSHLIRECLDHLPDYAQEFSLSTSCSDDTL